DIDLNLVDAQQARRVLDRLVGYELSPFLWRKIRYGLSAGRVQSVAVRLVVEREREIQAFKAEEYWSIEAQLTKQEVKRNPAPPFITSTLQQEAARKLGFSAKQTMAVAQHLYERGFITYMR